MGKPTYRKKWNAILAMYGVSKLRRDDFFNEIVPIMEEQVSDQASGYSEQLMLDAFAIVMHQDYGFGEVRWARLEKRIREVAAEIDLLSEREFLDNVKNKNFEANGKPDIPVTKHKIDEMLKPVYGSSFMVYDERYQKAQVEAREHDWAELKKLVKNGA